MTKSDAMGNVCIANSVVASLYEECRQHKTEVKLAGGNACLANARLQEQVLER